MTVLKRPTLTWLYKLWHIVKKPITMILYLYFIYMFVRHEEI